jgi:hypothetical protein
MMRARLSFLLLIATAGLLATAGCDQALPPALRASSCGGGPDRCAAMNCPAGMHCSLTSSCTPICEQEQLGNR